jgi:arginase
MAQFACFGVPYSLGEQHAPGSEVDLIRASGFAEEIGAEWVDIVPDFDRSPDPITAVNRALAAAISAQRESVPIIFAGDCLSALGAVKGLMTGAELGVVWYDAHGDFNTPETTPSGFLGGMPLAMLVGRGDMQYMQAVGLDPLDERDVILTDARDLDPAEGDAVRASAITHLPAVRDLLTAALPAKPLYVHLDVDVLNLDDMPAVGYPAAGGPSLADVAESLERVAREGHVAGLLASLWDQDRAVDTRPLHNTLYLVRALLAGL